MGSIRLFDQLNRLKYEPGGTDADTTGSFDQSIDSLQDELDHGPFGKVGKGEATLSSPLESDPVQHPFEIRELLFRILCKAGEVIKAPAPDEPIGLEFLIHHGDESYPLNYRQVPDGYNIRADDSLGSVTTQSGEINGVLAHSYHVTFSNVASIFLKTGDTLTLQVHRHLSKESAGSDKPTAFYGGPLVFALELIGLDEMQISPRRVRRRRDSLMFDQSRKSVLVLPAEARTDG